jgi:uncharacterized protein (DUF488 family)
VDPAKLFTIGHSTRSLDDFLELLKREGVTHLADVRAFPVSARYPHFSRDNLERSLPGHGITYSHHPSLGGRRPARRDSHNTQWRNSGFRGYADYMETREFSYAIDDLLGIAGRAVTAIMCAEAVPWRCHRSLISDAVLARGTPVFHIMDGNAEPHRLTSFARVDDNKRVRYDVAAQNELFDTQLSRGT